MVQSLKERLEAGRKLRVFALSRVVHPVVVEMYGLGGGFDGFWFDQEHGAMGIDEIRTCRLAARTCDMDCFVRVPPVGYWVVTQCLEAGAGGVMGAQIQSADHAAEFISWTKFAPEGIRGLHSNGRDANYLHLPPADFVEQSNRERLVAIQIETLGALEQVDQIAALPGIDLLFIGPADLSLALGIVGQFHHEKLWEAVGKVAAACNRHGTHWGTLCPDPQFAAKAAEHDCRLFSIGNDITALKHGVAHINASFGPA